jgi:hypothetical protein
VPGGLPGFPGFFFAIPGKCFVSRFKSSFSQKHYNTGKNKCHGWLFLPNRDRKTNPGGPGKRKKSCLMPQNQIFNSMRRMFISMKSKKVPGKKVNFSSRGIFPRQHLSYSDKIFPAHKGIFLFPTTIFFHIQDVSSKQKNLLVSNNKFLLQARIFFNTEESSCFQQQFSFIDKISLVHKRIFLF